MASNPAWRRGLQSSALVAAVAELGSLAASHVSLFMSSSQSTESVAERLAAVFHRSGYVRRQSARRLAADGYMGYKKGDEIRFVAASRSELASVQRLLRCAGFEPGRPFAKGRKFALPVYGRTAVQQLLSLLHDNHAA